VGNRTKVVSENVVNCPATGTNFCGNCHSGVRIAANPDVLRGGAAHNFALATAAKIVTGFGGCAAGFQCHAYALPVGIIHKLGCFCAFGYGLHLVKGVVNNALWRGGNIQAVGNGLYRIFPCGVVSVIPHIGFRCNISFYSSIVPDGLRRSSGNRNKPV